MKLNLYPEEQIRVFDIPTKELPRIKIGKFLYLMWN